MMACQEPQVSLKVQAESHLFFLEEEFQNGHNDVIYGHQNYMMIEWIISL